MDKKFERFLLLLTGYLVLCIALLSFTISKGDEVVWINGLHNTFLDGFFYLITSLGSGWIIIPFLIIGLFSKLRLSLAAGISFVLVGMICLLIKFLTNLPRPTSLLDASSLHYVPGVIVHSHNSFPSGHTATGFCIAVLIALYLQSRTAAFLSLTVAALVGLSRIYLLQHFLIDVTVGAFLGSSVSFSVWYLVQKIQLPWLDAPILTSFERKEVNNLEDTQFPSFSK